MFQIRIPLFFPDYKAEEQFYLNKINNIKNSL